MTEFQDNSPIPTALVFDVENVDRVDEPTAVAAYQIVHEALSNARKHGQATSVVVRLALADEAHLLLEVRDNGRGFEIAAERDETHRGLRNMSARVSELQGSFDVHSSPGMGATIRVQFPVQ